jgi:hypothetical protein
LFGLRHLCTLRSPACGNACEDAGAFRSKYLFQQAFEQPRAATVAALRECNTTVLERGASPGMSTGLYSPEEFRDNCGFGLIAHMSGDASHRLLQVAIESLTCMTHRGGIAADGRTGDGCGLLMQMPEAFMRDLAAELFGFSASTRLAVGQIFLSQEDARGAGRARGPGAGGPRQGLDVLGWREVPVDTSVCGDIALATLPRIEQLFIDGGELSQEPVHGPVRGAPARRDRLQRRPGLSTSAACRRG